ncbi:mucin-2 isoform X2 [Etheostoma spectabile]|uniref:mucin-2 isoform X2 n=1 Tax=Etheostoma spectabile TaxID=54343 RepID=UPI0013AFC692|nr:mucin-2-like isoform X2 [Etheostoma spectabile]
MLPPSKRFKMENSVSVHQNGIQTVKTGRTTLTPPMTPCCDLCDPRRGPCCDPRCDPRRDPCWDLCDPGVTPAGISVTPSVSPAVTSVTPSVTPAVTSVTPSVTPAVTDVTPSVTPAVTDVKPCSVSVSPLLIAAGSKQLSTAAASSVCGSTPTQALPPDSPMEVDPVAASQDRVLSSGDISAQMKELEKALSSSPEALEKSGNPAESQTPESGLVPDPGFTQTPEPGPLPTQTLAPPQQQKDLSVSLQEGQEIYIQTEGLTVQMAEPGLDRIVIVNGPDGTTMHIQTPEGVPLEAVQALLGIEASDAATNPQ